MSQLNGALLNQYEEHLNPYPTKTMNVIIPHFIKILQYFIHVKISKVISTMEESNSNLIPQQAGYSVNLIL